MYDRLPLNYNIEKNPDRQPELRTLQDLYLSDAHLQIQQ